MTTLRIGQPRRLGLMFRAHHDTTAGQSKPALYTPSITAANRSPRVLTRNSEKSKTSITAS